MFVFVCVVGKKEATSSRIKENNEKIIKEWNTGKSPRLFLTDCLIFTVTILAMNCTVIRDTHQLFYELNVCHKTLMHAGIG